MNMEENPSLWQDLMFPGICPTEHFLEIGRLRPEDGVKKCSTRKLWEI